MWRRRLFSEDIERLIDRVESLFEEIFSSEEAEKPMWNALQHSLEPLTEIVETPEEVIVKADLPLVRKEDLSVNVSERILTIEAKMHRPVRFERWICDRGQICFDTISKSIRLPVDVKPEEAQAYFRQGILEVRLPKKIARHRVKID